MATLLSQPSLLFKKVNAVLSFAKPVKLAQATAKPFPEMKGPGCVLLLHGID